MYAGIILTNQYFTHNINNLFLLSVASDDRDF